MTTSIRQFLLPSIFLVLAFNAKSSVAFTGECVCVQANTIATRWGPYGNDVTYGFPLNKGECFKLLISRTSYSLVLQENKGKLLIPTVGLKSMKCPPEQEDTVLKYTPSCPAIRSREEWHARKPKSRTELKLPVEYFVVHHSDTRSCKTVPECDKLVQSIQRYHMDTRKFDDIGYNFLIGGNGIVYEGRGWSIQGAHARNYNSKSIGICMLGNFENEKPTEAAMRSLKRMIKCASEKRQISKNYILAGHRDLGDTKCPGTALYNIIKEWPHFIKKMIKKLRHMFFYTSVPR